MKAYLELLAEIRQHGAQKRDRTGTGTSSLFGRQLRFDLRAGFPIVTTKKLHVPSIVHELLWFVRGGTHVGYLRENGVTIWDEWADENGELGPIYGAQWRGWEAEGGRRIDQLERVVQEIRTNPDSRRLIVSAWNVGSLERMALPPCHAFFQFYVAQGRLSCQMYQRSADVFLGLPFNISSYALLTHMVAQVTALEPGELVISLGDVHLYSNHVEQADLQLGRTPLDLPRLRLDPHVRELDKFEARHIELEGYRSHPAIKAPVAV